jgi:hypothetical protein
MQFFRNHYRCERCGSQWTDIWSARSEDDCHSVAPLKCRRTKRVELIKETVPALTRMGLMSNPTNPTPRTVSEVEKAARSLSIELHKFDSPHA